MADNEKPPEVEEEIEAERRFNEALKRLVNTPHKPHEEKGRERKPAPKS